MPPNRSMSKRPSKAPAMAVATDSEGLVLERLACPNGPADRSRPGSPRDSLQRLRAVARLLGFRVTDVALSKRITEVPLCKHLLSEWDELAALNPTMPTLFFQRINAVEMWVRATHPREAAVGVSAMTARAARAVASLLLGGMLHRAYRAALVFMVTKDTDPCLVAAEMVLGGYETAEEYYPDLSRFCIQPTPAAYIMFWHSAELASRLELPEVVVQPSRLINDRGWKQMGTNEAASSTAVCTTAVRHS